MRECLRGGSFRGAFPGGRRAEQGRSRMTQEEYEAWLEQRDSDREAEDQVREDRREIERILQDG